MDYSELKVPNHVAIILDGNGRWAHDNGMTRSEGHLNGFNNLESLSNYIFKKGIKVLSVYAFSTENFKRSKDEVDYLMNLFVKGFKKYAKSKNKNNVKMVFSGRREPLPKDVLKVIDEVTEMTKDNTGAIFNICVNYGSGFEIEDMVKKVCKKVVDGEITIDEIDNNIISKNMYNDLPQVDLMIRTSGEQRLSNFLLWQNAYAEFYFPKVHFPAFDENEFDKAIIEYTKRDRRFGGIDYSKFNK